MSKEISRKEEKVEKRNQLTRANQLTRQSADKSNQMTKAIRR
jgi:hypothetical protein